MNTPIVPDHVFKMWDDPRFEILAEVDRLLNGNRVWGGMEYTYHPIHPDKYKPVAVKVRKALYALQLEYGVEE